MSDLMSMYRSKLVSAEEAAKQIKSGMFLWNSGFNGKPVAFDDALAARKDELDTVIIVNTLTMPPLPQTFLCDPTSEHFICVSAHFSLVDRKLHDLGRTWYAPIHYHEVPRWIAAGYNPVNAAAMQVTPMDKHGYFNFGPQASHAMDILMSAKRHGGPVIVEVNEKMPRCLGGYHEAVHVSEVDFIVEGPNPDLFDMPPAVPSPEDQKIADLVLSQMRDGDCIQLGIGGAPTAIGSMIADSDLKDLGVHTEMLVDAYVDMYEKGRITNRKKVIDKGRSVYTFAVGSKRLYDFIDDNPACATYSVGYTNDPRIAAQNPNFVAINNAVMVDLFGQATGETFGTRQISGSGGMLDFAIAGFESEGGRSFIILRSTYTNSKGELKSRIVPRFPEGTVVTIPRSISHYIVTEYGIAQMKARTTWQRAEAIINLAAPQFRDDLIKEAAAMKIWVPSNKRGL